VFERVPLFREVVRTIENSGDGGTINRSHRALMQKLGLRVQLTHLELTGMKSCIDGYFAVFCPALETLTFENTRTRTTGISFGTVEGFTSLRQFSVWDGRIILGDLPPSSIASLTNSTMEHCTQSLGKFINLKCQHLAADSRGVQHSCLRSHNSSGFRSHQLQSRCCTGERH
jgi:hypothetical protein